MCQGSSGWTPFSSLDKNINFFIYIFFASQIGGHYFLDLPFSSLKDLSWIFIVVTL